MTGTQMSRKSKFKLWHGLAVSLALHSALGVPFVLYALAEPPDEPPGTSMVLAPSRRQGLTTGPKHEVSFDEPMANSSMATFPRITAPADLRRATTVASKGGW